MKETMIKNNHEQGFSLVELMIVIAIMGILAAIAIPNFLSYQKKGYDVAAHSDAMNFLSCALTHFADIGTATETDLSCKDNKLPNGYKLKDDIVYDGTITQDTVGGVSGTMTFKHTKSSQVYKLFGSSGTIEKQ